MALCFIIPNDGKNLSLTHFIIVLHFYHVPKAGVHIFTLEANALRLIQRLTLTFYSTIITTHDCCLPNFVSLDSLIWCQLENKST